MPYVSFFKYILPLVLKTVDLAWSYLLASQVISALYNNLPFSNT